MARSGNENSGQPPVGGDLEPYRRLVELQKQMIELAEQHEQTRRRRDALHEQMVREAASRRQDRRGLRHRLQQSAANLFKRMPGFAPDKNNDRPAFDRDQPSC